MPNDTHLDSAEGTSTASTRLSTSPPPPPYTEEYSQHSTTTTTTRLPNNLNLSSVAEQTIQQINEVKKKSLGICILYTRQAAY